MDLTKQKILVTGADGFIGSHLVEDLLDRGCPVRAFVFYNSFNSWGWLDTFPKDKLDKLEVFAGDIRDPNGVRKAMQGMDMVFHLAALIAIPFSYHSPDSYVDTNIKGTLNVLQAARDTACNRVLITSTSEVYGTAQYVPIDEGHPFQGQSPYSATKIGADRIAESFYRSFNTPVTIVRPFNTYGPRQSARAVIPTVITQLLAGSTEVRLGNIQPTRDFNYVKDTVDGFIAIAGTQATIGEEINIASQQEISIEQLVREIINQINPTAILKGTSRIVSDESRVRPEKSEVERLLGSNEKIRRLTGWQPAYTLKQGIRETIEWFRVEENLRRYKWDVYNV
jgi:NAD dependent epimerase/dehydratase